MAGQATKKTGQGYKQTIINELKDSVQQSTVAIVADYRGLSVADLTNLRRELFKHQAKFTVTKNTFMARAVDGTDHQDMASLFKGPSAVLFGNGDQVQPVKIFKKFLKDNKKDNVIFGGFMEGRVLSAKEVDELANLPSFDELRAKLLGCIASPLNGVVGALSSQQRSLVNVRDQYAKTKPQS